MYPPQVREEVGVVAPEVRKELRVLVEAQELAYDLDGKHLRVEKRRSRSTLSEASEVSDAVVYEAKDGYDEGAKIHESGDLLLASVGLGTTERREVSLFLQQFGEVRRNLHTGLTRKRRGSGPSSRWDPSPNYSK